MKIYESQNRRMKRNFAQSVDIASFDYLDPVEDKVRIARDIGMVNVQLVSQQSKYAERKPFEDIDDARAFQAKAEYGTWMDKFQARETDRIDTKVTHIMQKYCTPRGRDLKGVSHSIDMTKTSNDLFPYNRQTDNRTEFSTKYSSAQHQQQKMYQTQTISLPQTQRDSILSTLRPMSNNEIVN